MQRLSSHSLRFFASIFLSLALCGHCVPGLAQQAPASGHASAQAGKQAAAPPHMSKPPAIADPAGPTVSLQSSEALFDIAVALNACGYDGGLAESDPIRQEVRNDVEEALRGSADGRAMRDQLCVFIDQHRLFEGSRDLAQYVSLALYVTQPPELKTSVDEADLPPDATQVVGILPILQRFADAIQLHLIWLRHHTEYEAAIDKIHDTLNKMILNTNIYLRQPLSTYTNSRFLVVLEPMLDPKQVNARIYGGDFIVVATPVKGQINMQDVRHTYLHYEVEPLVYSHSSAMDRMLPILKVVHDAPIDWNDRADISTLVVECMVHAVEIRTMDSGIAVFELPPNAPRSEIPRLQHQRDVTVAKDNAVREAAVEKAMRQGYVLTRYFYEQFVHFERSQESLSQAVGPMVFGMDVDSQVHQARNIEFVQQAPEEVIRAPISSRGLDQAEARLKAGDAEGANKLALQALHDHTADAGRANYLLGLSWLMKGDPQSAQNDFTETLHLTQDPRLLAWSHIWLGRISDVEQQRDQAVTEYKTALDVRDGQQDTLEAAEKGLRQPYTLNAANSAPATPQPGGAPPENAPAPQPQ